MVKHPVLRSLLLGFILVLALSGFGGNNHQKIINQVMASTLRITGSKTMMTFWGPMTGEYTCTGWVIGENRAMTAEHCVGDNMTADGHAVEVIRSDKFYDLAYLEVYTPKKPLKLTDKVIKRGDRLTAVGYGFGWTRMTTIECVVMLVDYMPPQTGLPPGLWLQGQYIGGMSGGPVFDEKGRIVGIVQRAGEGVGYGVGTLLMRAFLLGID